MTHYEIILLLLEPQNFTKAASDNSDTTSIKVLNETRSSNITLTYIFCNSFCILKDILAFTGPFFVVSKFVIVIKTKHTQYDTQIIYIYRDGNLNDIECTSS